MQKHRETNIAQEIAVDDCSIQDLKRDLSLEYESGPQEDWRLSIAFMKHEHYSQNQTPSPEK